MNTFKQTAIDALRKSSKPLHYREITRIALEEGGLVTEGATPEATMNAQITTDIKVKGTASDFIKVSPGVFGPNPANAVTAAAVDEWEDYEERVRRPAVESGYTGKGGEHLVCSELLFRGFNASIMSVDVGVDISAIKDNQFFGIQVKTSNINSFGVYNFHIRRTSFEKHNKGNVFYIFVLKGSDFNEFLILPASEIELKVKEKAIYTVNSQTGYALSIRIKDETEIMLGNGHKMNKFLNNWNLIK
jgi:hypothetical protein